MTPFKRERSPYYYIRPSVPGYGRLGPWSTGTTNKARAQSMAVMVKELVMTGHGDIIRLIQEGHTNIQEVWVAKLEGRLDEILDRKDNPLLEEVIREAERYNEDVPTGRGLKQILRLAPPNARLSCLQ